MINNYQSPRTGNYYCSSTISHCEKSYTFWIDVVLHLFTLRDLAASRLSADDDCWTMKAIMQPIDRLAVTSQQKSDAARRCRNRAIFMHSVSGVLQFSPSLDFITFA